MEKFGFYLKSLRIQHGLSLKDLARQIGTSDTILSRLENGQLPKDLVTIFSSLAKFYNINVIVFYLESGIISPDALNEYSGIFKNCNQLEKTEIDHIQREIDFIISLKNKRQE